MANNELNQYIIAREKLYYLCKIGLKNAGHRPMLSYTCTDACLRPYM